ncbi:Probable peptide chain release factor, mitochondrial [Galdieria sulphuraria]|uniref:Bacterial peptide chain release factor-like protein n=1 Tax=Galdieria sulphuraria TaxID=130081 RepID=M2W9M1_GALSU|nr:bacterial peptide chain release factor-like protein [Galdieria sulphuraria]EME32601.1 bacterial peptide chain release factor-like protein [Galdieria sulphuraria]GJD12907.1 Probable peptide chain release factor, mitochondrial [Galdieria sulphuraria]|eukprot:XP_005709121.1 bacterial peptide chain release factor-like protein [Galdieria sulphuraria]
MGTSLMFSGRVMLNTLFPRCFFSLSRQICIHQHCRPHLVFQSFGCCKNMLLFCKKPSSLFSQGATLCSTSDNSSENQSQESVLKQQMNKLQVEHMSIELREQDLDEKFIRGGGPGGQSINKTESCVVLVHKPTGIWVKCQESRSQFRNRQIARQRLKEKIDLYYRGEESKVAQKIAKIRARKANRRKKAIKKHYKSKKEREQSDEESVKDLFEQDDVWFSPKD